MRWAPPTLVFGVIGQAKAAGRIAPESEGQLLAALLSNWALRAALQTASACSGYGQRESLGESPLINPEQKNN